MQSQISVFLQVNDAGENEIMRSSENYPQNTKYV